MFTIIKVLLNNIFKITISTDYVIANNLKTNDIIGVLAIRDT